MKLLDEFIRDDLNINTANLLMDVLNENQFNSNLILKEFNFNTKIFKKVFNSLNAGGRIVILDLMTDGPSFKFNVSISRLMALTLFNDIIKDFNKNKDIYMFYLYPLVFNIKTNKVEQVTKPIMNIEGAWKLVSTCKKIAQEAEWSNFQEEYIL